MVAKIDTPCERRRGGIRGLAGGIILLAIATTLAVRTGNGRCLLGASPAMSATSVLGAGAAHDTSAGASIAGNEGRQQGWIAFSPCV